MKKGVLKLWSPVDGKHWAYQSWPVLVCSTSTPAGNDEFDRLAMFVGSDVGIFRRSISAKSVPKVPDGHRRVWILGINPDLSEKIVQECQLHKYDAAEAKKPFKNKSEPGIKQMRKAAISMAEDIQLCSSTSPGTVTSIRGDKKRRRGAVHGQKWKSSLKNETPLTLLDMLRAGTLRPGKAVLTALHPESQAQILLDLSDDGRASMGGRTNPRLDILLGDWLGKNLSQGGTRNSNESLSATYTVVSFAGKTLKQLSMMHSESTILRKSGTKRKDERHKKSRKSTAEKKSCNLNACPYYRELQAYTRSLLEKFSLPVVSTPLALEETQVEAYRSEAAGGPPHCLHDEKPILGSSPVWDQGRFVVRDSLTPPVDEGHLSYAGGDGQDQILVGKRSSRRAQTNRKTSSMAAELSSGNLDCHTLLMCEEYGQGGQGPQPFAVKMHPTAAFLCDLHAHLSESEIIGLLGGRWDEQGKCLYIHMPFPCRATEREDDGSTDVEMESTSQVEAARLVSESGLVVVGWYHSHPTFQPEPSVTDIENQANFQNMFKDAAPCVGLIVGTHGESPTDYVSHFNFFHVPDVGRVNLPLRLRAHVLSCTPSYQDEAAYSATGLSECKEMLSRLCQLDLERRNRQNELRVQAGMLPSTTNPRKVPRRCKSALMSDTSEAGKGEGLPKSLQFIVEVGDLPQAGMERLFQDLGFLAVNPPMVFGSEFAALVHAHGCALTPLQGLCHSAKQLCAYYAHVERRVNFASPWRGGISRGEKMARALSVWLKFLEAPLVQAADVLRDVCQLFFATWSEKGVEDFSKRMERNPPSHRCVDGSKCPAVAL